MSRNSVKPVQDSVRVSATSADLPSPDPATPAEPLGRFSGRARLLNAARALCINGAYLAASVEEIAEFAGLSRAAFYLHFRNKDDLIKVVMEDQLDWYVRMHTKLSPRQAANRASLIAWLGQFVTGWRSAGQLMAQTWPGSRIQESYRKFHRHRCLAMDTLAARIPRLRVLREDGSVDPDRRMELLLFFFERDQLCLYVAHVSDEFDQQAALGKLADHFQRLLRD